MINFIVKENNKMILATSDYTLGCSAFLAKVKEVIRDNFGFLGNFGLPYSLEAYLCVDDEVSNNKKLLKKTDDIINLFKKIQQLDVHLTDKKKLKDIQFSDDEWDFKFDANDGLAEIKSIDGIHYLKTNIFNNLKETNQLYFMFCLENVVTTHDGKFALGQENKYEISLEISLKDILKFEVDHFKRSFVKE